MRISLRAIPSLSEREKHCQNGSVSTLLTLCASIHEAVSMIDNKRTYTYHLYYYPCIQSDYLLDSLKFTLLPTGCVLRPFHQRRQISIGKRTNKLEAAFRRLLWWRRDYASRSVWEVGSRAGRAGYGWKAGMIIMAATVCSIFTIWYLYWSENVYIFCGYMSCLSMSWVTRCPTDYVELTLLWYALDI